MPRGGDYPGFGLRGQERRKRFDLRAEAEPPSPSARVTHRGCGWEVDPERGLNQATAPGARVWGWRVGSEAVRVWRGRPGERVRRGKEAAGQRASAPRPLPSLPLSSGFCRGSERRDPRPQARARAGGVVLPTRLLWVSCKPAEGCTLVVVCFVLVTARLDLD